MYLLLLERLTQYNSLAEILNNYYRLLLLLSNTIVNNILDDYLQVVVDYFIVIKQAMGQ